ncbi:MAG: class I SAM-dependent methyltransferase [Clostridium sp.]|nr:class I SAM-dependent methyltransferase [Clostridium sp.]
MNDNRTYWNNIYKDISDTVIDTWLEEYRDILDKAKEKKTPILDLGCGAGGNSLYLNRNEYNVIVCDYSNEALKIVNNNVPSVKTFCIDFSETLPFKDKSTYLIIADLSLHYFNTTTTNKIISELKRILMDDGYLIIRVNSVNDKNYGANQGTFIEENFYLTKSGYKRFFNNKSIENFFREWTIEVVKEVEIDRFGLSKKAIQCVIKNEINNG